MKISKRNKWILYFLIAFYSLLINFILIDYLFPYPVDIDYSQVITASDGSVVHAFLNKSDKWRLKAGLDEITPLLRKTIIYKEDKYFYYHFGINPVSVLRAVFKNIIRGERTSGASTLTMQVTRMLEPKERNYKNKLLEMFRAMQIEWRYTKDEILQMYMNLLPYSGNIEGVKTASIIYFDQEPEALSLAQIVTLTIIPNNPSKMRIGQNNSYIIEERNKWLKKLSKSRYFTKAGAKDAMEEPLDAYRHAVPRYAPHLSNLLRNTYPGQVIINTYLDPAIQKRVENITFNYIKRLKKMNITNAAVLVINNQSYAVECYLGSADFFDNENQGQVDGVQAVRSPGSTLKPFLYALAIDKGIVNPKTIIPDVPVNYSGYSPENYDGKYRGLISVEEALAFSLNVPAVRILDEYHTDNFINKLVEAGFQSIEKKREDLGLSVILGGCGVRLAELTQMFSAFANKGHVIPLQYTRSENSTDTNRLFSPAASFMITDMLSKIRRPDLPSKFESSMNLPKIAWKTGTSYGRRDAWSIGYNKQYTIGVWVGNFPGLGVPEMNGADYAAPLLFNIFNAIVEDGRKDWFDMPDDIDFRLVCSESGLPPGDHCNDLVMDYFIPGISSNTKCQHVKQVFTDEAEIISYCRSCMPSAGYKKVLYPHIPAEVISFYEEQNIPYTQIPPHNPECTRIFDKNAPVITSLNDGMEYILFEDEEQQLLLRCNTENDVKTVYWYTNDVFLQKAAANDKVFFKPKKGVNKISCTDDKGRNSDIWIQIVFI